MESIVNIKSSSAEVALEFANFFADLVNEKDRVTIALSGGSTPALLFDILARKFQDLEWNKVHLFWGDERCVPSDHEESNFKMTWDRLISKINIPEMNIHRIIGESYPDKEAKRYAEEIKQSLESYHGIPSFDIVLLGMGTDGHTASIFPHQMDLLESTRICAVANHPDTGQKRVSLTGPVINAAQNVCFLVTGHSKTQKVREILGKEGLWENYPSAHIQPIHGKLYWFLDEAAAGGL